MNRTIQQLYRVLLVLKWQYKTDEHGVYWFKDGAGWRRSDWLVSLRHQA